MTTTNPGPLRNYHHPVPVSHDITAARVRPPFTSKDGQLFAIVEMGDGGQLWLADPAVARQLLMAVFGALRILDPDGAVIARATNHELFAVEEILPPRTAGSELVDAAIEQDPAGVADALVAAVATGRHEEEAQRALDAATACRDCGATQDEAPLQDVIVIGESSTRTEFQCWNHDECTQRQQPVTCAKCGLTAPKTLMTMYSTTSDVASWFCQDMDACSIRRSAARAGV
jgi:hypothetical protein